MSKKDEFKEFIRNKPELVNYMKENNKTIQDFYEIYDIYGDNPEAWKPYQKSDLLDRNKITDIMKNINVDELQKHINTAQKAIGVVEDFTTKNTTNIGSSVKGPLSPRPLNKFFED